MSENKAVKVRRWTLSEGKNVKSKTLTRKTIGEDDFWTEFKLVEDTTGYHFKEYRELSSSGIKSDIAKAKKQKDGPIFIAGEFADNRRLDKNLYSRSMLTLDLDHPKDSSLKQLLDRIEKSLSVLGDVNIIVYPSYSFTTPKPRLRVIVPLASDITFDTEQGKPLYQSVARYVIEAIGSEHFDIATSVSAIARPTYKPRVPRGFFDKKLNPYGSLEEWPVIFGKESAFLDAYALLESGDISITETDKKSRSKKSAEIIDFKAAQDERPEWTKAPDPEYTGPYNDDKLIEIAMKPQRNSGFAGATFKSLYNNDGAQLRKFYKSDKMECDHNYSDADMALCHRLLYYTGNDCERTLHLLMQSQRVTDKWLTRIDDYVKRTISNALAQRRKNNSPIYKYIGEDADVDIPEIAEYCEFSDIDFVLTFPRSSYPFSI